MQVAAGCAARAERRRGVGKMNCSNCNGEIIEKFDVLLVTRGLVGAPVAVICKQCETDVLVLKIVLARQEPKKEFAFDGYLPVSSVK